jgi:hypothetical protein
MAARSGQPRPFRCEWSKKSSLYRHEVSEAATRALLKAVERFVAGGFVPTPVDDADPTIRGRAAAVDAAGRSRHRLAAR